MVKKVLSVLIINLNLLFLVVDVVVGVIVFVWV